MRFRISDRIISLYTSLLLYQRLQKRFSDLCKTFLIFLQIWLDLRKRASRKKFKWLRGLRNSPVTSSTTFSFLVSLHRQASKQLLISLTVRSLSAKTPQITPRLSALLYQDNNILVGTTKQLSLLGAKCLIRDRHRYVISRQIDITEAESRFEIMGINAIDDDRLPLANRDMGYVKAIYIIPHTLGSSDDPSNGSFSFLYTK